MEENKVISMARTIFSKGITKIPGVHKLLPEIFPGFSAIVSPLTDLLKGCRTRKTVKLPKSKLH